MENTKRQIEEERGWFINLNKSERYVICGGGKKNTLVYGSKYENVKVKFYILFIHFFLSILNYLHKRVQCIHDLPFMV